MRSLNLYARKFPKVGSFYNKFLENKKFKLQNGEEFLKKFLSMSMHNHDWRHKIISIEGKMGSGKTFLSTVLADIVTEKYHLAGFEVNTFMVSKFSDLLNLGIDECPVQLCILDDFMRDASNRSWRSKKREEDTFNLTEIRHKCQKISGRNGGLVFIIFNFQIPASIDRRYRALVDCHVMKSCFDDDIMKHFTKNNAIIDSLNFIDKQIGLEDNEEFKGCAIAKAYREFYGIGITEEDVRNCKPVPFLYQEDEEKPLDPMDLQIEIKNLTLDKQILALLGNAKTKMMAISDLQNYINKREYSIRKEIKRLQDEQLVLKIGNFDNANYYSLAPFEVF